jgi:NAD(P)-dependent dehydrogenase (short-subunit alcohol dehydrogenase family)
LIETKRRCCDSAPNSPEASGRINIFFNDAGIEGPVHPIVQYHFADFRRVLDGNVAGVFLGSKQAPDQERGLADKALDWLHGITERGVGRGFWNAEAIESARRNLSVANGLADHASPDRRGGVQRPEIPARL